MMIFDQTDGDGDQIRVNSRGEGVYMVGVTHPGQTMSHMVQLNSEQVQDLIRNLQHDLHLEQASEAYYPLDSLGPTKTCTWAHLTEPCGEPATRVLKSFAVKRLNNVNCGLWLCEHHTVLAITRTALAK
jgi:hypothetical protein